MFLIWCHGGCFGGGLPTFDYSLRKYVEEQGMSVISVDFDRTNWNNAINDVYNIVSEIGPSNVVLGGISSGGLLAHTVANMINRPAALICPVIKPYDRHANLPEQLQKDQLTMFHSKTEMKRVQDSVELPNAPRFIIYGVQDTRAPLQAYENWLNSRRVFLYGHPGGHEICTKPPLNIFWEGLKSIMK